MAHLRSYSPRARRLGGVALVAVAALSAACAENIESGAACPVLCPIENEVVRDTLIDAVALDTTLAGFPFPGDADFLLVALRPGADSLDVRAVVRFDTIPDRFLPSGTADSASITRVDSAFVRFIVDSASLRAADGLRLEAYDVDTAAAVDTVSAALAALFRPDRFLGSVPLERAGLRGDTLRVPIADSAIVAKAGGSRRLRVGVRLVGAGAGSLRIRSAIGGASTAGATLTFDPGPDTTYAPYVLAASSTTPANGEIAAGLRDFSFAAVTGTPIGGSDLVVGGVPGRRVLLRFAIPRALTDSTTIVRATLRLVQAPTRGATSADTVAFIPDAVVANETITDLRRVAELTGSGAAFGIDTVRVAASDSGRRDVSIVNLVRAWRALPAGTQRGVILRSVLEGADAGAVRFHSSEAASALRPQLQISYIPRSNFGLP